MSDKRGGPAGQNEIADKGQAKSCPGGITLDGDDHRRVHGEEKLLGSVKVIRDRSQLSPARFMRCFEFGEIATDAKMSALGRDKHRSNPIVRGTGFYCRTKVCSHRPVDCIAPFGATQDNMENRIFAPMRHAPQSGTGH